MPIEIIIGAVNCKVCSNAGFIIQCGVRYVRQRDGTITTRIDKFRVPCRCEIGKAWAESKRDGTI